MNLTEQIVGLRLTEPDLASNLTRQRQRRNNWAHDKLVILAVDHPARRTVSAGGNPWAMANRDELLRRTCSVLRQPFIDGLLATPDIVEEVILLSKLNARFGGEDFIQEKILVGSMNRGGLSGTIGELDDFVTAYNAESISEQNLDAGKLLLRIDVQSRDSTRTLKYCAESLAELSRRDIPCFLEPIAVNGGTDELVQLIGVSTGLGVTSARRWLKVPMVDEFHRVSGATTCPILLLGGANPGTTQELARNVVRCMQTGPNVRGLMIGRGVLFPEDGLDPAVVAAKLAAAVHGDEREAMRWDSPLFTPSAV